MDVVDIITTTLSVIAIIVSIIAIYKSTKLSHASIENTIAEGMNSTKNRISDISLTIVDIPDKPEEELTPEEKRKCSTYRAVFKAALENHLNSVEIACANYRDGKIDRKRFKKNYHVEIRQLFDNPQFKPYLDTRKATYECIKHVYDSWNNLEK